MGAGLAKRAVFVRVNPRARLLLVAMALTAKDTDDLPAYYGGWDYLALVLGYHDGYTKLAERNVAKAVAELVAAGLIKPDGYAPGGNRRYVLRL